MNRQDSRLQPDWATLILSLTLFLGFLVRFFPGFLAGFPLNDGGMFLTMIQDLRENAFRLPAFTTYNQAGIPFAYPPLGFYLAGLLSLVGIPPLQVLRWLPPLVNFLSIFAFYRLALALLEDRPRAAVASMAFALLPGSFSWQIMGGGLTRSLGMLFILLANHAVYRLFRRGEWKLIFPAALFCALAVLSHPEVSLATVVSCALFWLFFGRTWRSTLQAAGVAIGTLLLTSPWWGSVLSVHGLRPFLTAMHTGAYVVINPVLEFLQDGLTFDVWNGVFNLLFWPGLLWAIRQRQFFVLAWLILPYFSEPRSAPAFAHFPKSILVAWAILDVLPAAWRRLRQKTNDLSSLPVFAQRGFTLALFGLMFLWFVESAFWGLLLALLSLRPPAPQEVMEWERQSTPVDSRFVILSGNVSVMTDPMQEWFPALSGRRCQSTAQGTEWTLADGFFPRLGQLYRLQECSQITCVEQWSQESGLTYSHLLILKKPSLEPLIHSARQAGYRLLFENEAAMVLEKGK